MSMTSQSESKVKWNASSLHGEGRVSVQDVIHLLSRYKPNDKRRSRTEADEAESRLALLLPGMKTAQILAHIENVKELNKDHVPLTHSSDILAVPSDSLTGMFALSDKALDEPEILVVQAKRDAYFRSLQRRAVPNSEYKKLPKTFPLPPPSWEDNLQVKIKQQYVEVYGPTKPKPNYPILPPRERPVEVKEPVEKKKSKKKKGKKKKHKEPPPPLDVTAWRKENLPVASTKLWYPYFEPAPCYQPTPDRSNPPTPLPFLPEPVSQFGYFINHLPETKKEKSTKAVRYYAPVPSFISIHGGSTEIDRRFSALRNTSMTTNP